MDKDELEAQIDYLTIKVDNLESEVGYLEGRVDTLESKLSQVAADLEDL